MKRLLIILIVFYMLICPFAAVADSESEMLLFDSFNDKEYTRALWKSVSGSVDVGTIMSDSTGVSAAEFPDKNKIQSIVAGESTWSDYTLSVDMCFLKSGIAGIFFRYQSDTRHYLLQYADNTITLSKRDGSNSYQRIHRQEFEFLPCEMVRFTITVAGAQIDVYADGEHLFSANDSSSESGKIGLRAYTGHVSFDNVAVYIGKNEPQALPVKRDFTITSMDVSGINQFYYVSPMGNDSNNGSIDAPFKTIGKARDVIKASVVPQGGVMVYLRGGEYYLENGEYFYDGSGGSESSPIVYSSYPGERASLTGAVDLNESSITEVPDEIINRLPYPDNVLAFDLSKIGISEIEDITTDGKYYSLYYNDLELPQARWPNNGWLRTGKIIERGSRPGFGETDGRGFEFLILDNRPQRWRDDDNIWMYGAWSREWKYSNVKVSEFDDNSGTVTTVQPSEYGAEQGMPYYYYNVLEELDTPGEWYIDKDRGLIYLYPPDKADINKLSLSSSKYTLLRIANTGNIVFQNLDIKYGHAGGVDISNSNNIILQGCRVIGLGQIGVTIKGRNCGFLNGEISNTGGSGIFISSSVSDRKALYESQNFCFNSHIFNCGRNDNSYLAVVSGIGNIFTDNFVSDGGNGGILFGGNENLIAYNEVSNVCKLVNDGGAIYATGRDFTQRGNKVMYNYIHDVNGSSRKNLVGPSGIYLDALMSGTKVYGNTIVRTTLPILMGGGRDNEITNNFLLQSTENSLYAINADQRGVDTSEYEDQGTVWDRVLPSLQESYNSMPCTGGVWSAKYPSLANVWDDEPQLPKYNKIENNFVYNHKNNQIAENVSEYGNVTENLIISDTDNFKEYEADNYVLNIDSDFYTQSETLRNTSFSDTGISCVTCDGGIGEFYLIYPYDGTVIRNKENFLSWGSAKGADTYHLEVAKDTSFAESVLDVVTTETYHMLPELESDTEFYWRVTAGTSSNSFNGSSKISEVKSFCTMTERELLDELIMDSKELFNTAVHMNPLPVERATLNEFRATIDSVESSIDTAGDGELRQTLASAVSDFHTAYLSEMKPIYSFNDGFNALDEGETPVYDEVRGSVTVDDLGSGEKALLLKDDSSALYPVLIKKTEPITNIGHFSFRIKPMQRNGFIYVKLRQVTSTAYFDPIVFAFQNGGITVNNIPLCAFQANIWYKVDIDVDAENKLFGVSVNGEELIENIPYKDADFINAIVFTGNTYTGQNYLDDITAEAYSGELKPRYNQEILDGMCAFECIVLQDGKILNLGEHEVTGNYYTAYYNSDEQLRDVTSTPLTLEPGEASAPDVSLDDCQIMFWTDECFPLSTARQICELP